MQKVASPPASEINGKRRITGQLAPCRSLTRKRKCFAYDRSTISRPCRLFALTAFHRRQSQPVRTEVWAKLASLMATADHKKLGVYEATNKLIIEYWESMGR